MIRSMTGFGKGESKCRYGSIKVEVRAINHKFLDMSVRLPDGVSEFEDRVRSLAGRFVKR